MTIVEEDDGSGWVKVADEKGAHGLVPATYIEIVEDVSQQMSQSRLQPPRPALGRPKPGAKPASLGSGVYGPFTNRMSKQVVWLIRTPSVF